jgi:cytochrome c551/c552
MNRILALAALAALLSLPAAALGTDGKAIFDANRCGACHKEEAAGVGPSLKEIADLYAGNKSQMVSLLEGTGAPLKDTGKYERTMTRPIEKLKGLSAEELGALADYLVEAQ